MFYRITFGRLMTAYDIRKVTIAVYPQCVGNILHVKLLFVSHLAMPIRRF